MLAAADLIRGLISGLVLAFALFLSWSVATRPYALPQGPLDDARARQGGAVSFQSAPARDGAGTAAVALRRAVPRGGAVPDAPPPLETRFTAAGAGYRIHVPSRLAAGGRPAGAVVLLGDASADSDALMAAWADVAARAGLVLLAPTGDWPSLPAADLADRLAEILAAEGAGRAVLFGHGAGGAAALALANRDGGRFAGVAAHAALPPRLLNAADGPPVVLLRGERDGRIPAGTLAARAEAMAGAGHRVRLVEIAGAGPWFADHGAFVAAEAWAFLRAP